MMATDFAEAVWFQGWIAKRLGLHYGNEKLGVLAALLTERAGQRRITPRRYLDSLGDVPTQEWRALVAALTVPETYFFRHLDQLNAFCEVAAPRALTAADASPRLRILCAGCASGEEPYSLSIWMREHGIDSSRVAIHAVDLNAAMLAKATAARYSAWSLRETTQSLRERWFMRDGQEYVLATPIRASVEFEEFNLADPGSAWWPRGTFDVIFCRNVLMYLTREATAYAIARLTDALVPGGYFFMGHAETLRGLSDEFELCQSHNAFYYRRWSGVHATPQRSESAMLPDSFGGPNKPPAELPYSLPQPLPRVADRGEPPAGGADLTNVWRLLAEERFSDAIEALESMPQMPTNPQAQLLRAALLTHSGALTQAERECVSLLACDGANAGAHYLLALCRDAAHDRRSAIDHDREAMALSPEFALPPLHLGLMARRAGDPEDALRHFDVARKLLQTENAERLLLFGGGFSRAALVSLCGESASRSPHKAAR